MVFWVLIVFNFAIITNPMLWKFETFDLTAWNSLANTFESSLSWHIFWTALCLSAHLSRCGSVVVLHNLSSAWCTHILCNIPQMLDICKTHTLYHSICISVGACVGILVGCFVFLTPAYFYHIKFSAILRCVKHCFCAVFTLLPS